MDLETLSAVVTIEAGVVGTLAWGLRPLVRGARWLRDREERLDKALRSLEHLEESQEAIRTVQERTSARVEEINARVVRLELPAHRRSSR